MQVYCIGKYIDLSVSQLFRYLHVCLVIIIPTRINTYILHQHT